MATKVYGYRPGSRGAKALADAVGGRVLRHEGSTYRPRPADTVINWGSGSTDVVVLNNCLNRPQAVARASNKLSAFRAMRDAGVSIPDFWERAEDIPDDAFPVVCRTVLNGHSGNGIVIADNRGAVVRCNLYTRYVKKQDEYRIHVGVREGGTSIISQQRKARRNGVEDADFRVRNLANGFVFVREGVNPPAAVLEQSRLALTALGLDFGAVDVIWNERQQRAYVLEINTAPGLEGQTVTDYANYFRNR